MLKKCMFFILFSSACFADFAWSPPLDPPQVNTNIYGRVAVNDNMSIAVWQSNDGAQDTVAAILSNDGGSTWSGPITLSETGPGVNSRNPEVVMNVNNEIVVCWRKVDAAGNNIAQVNCSNDGGSTWTGPITLNLLPSMAQSVNVALSDLGVAVCVWHNNIPGPTWVVEASLTENIMSWPAPLPFPGNAISNPASNCTNADVCISSSGIGNYFALCGWSNTSTGFVETTVYNKALGLWLGIVPHGAPTGSYAHVAISNSNNMVFMWSDNSTGLNAINTSISSNGTVWLPIGIISNPAESVGLSSALSTINSSGQVIATWYRGPIMTQTIQVSYSTDNGNTWFSYFDVSNPNPITLYPKVALNDAGEAVCVFQSGFSSTVHTVTSLDGGANWLPQIDLSAVGGGSTAAVDIAPNGNTVAIWHDSTGLIQLAYSPFSPFSLTYNKATTKLLLQRDHTNELIWSPISEAVIYKIYEDRPFQNLIYSGRDNYFVHHGQKKGEEKKYYFTWIKSDGTESAAEEVIIP